MEKISGPCVSEQITGQRHRLQSNNKVLLKVFKMNIPTEDMGTKNCLSNAKLLARRVLACMWAKPAQSGAGSLFLLISLSE
jgi:hypothetical protein